jgi:signal peptidase
MKPFIQTITRYRWLRRPLGPALLVVIALLVVRWWTLAYVPGHAVALRGAYVKPPAPDRSRRPIMTALIQTFKRGRWIPQELRPALYVLVALLVARWWALEYVPGHVFSLWGPYFLAPLGWSLAAAAGLYFYRHVQWQPLIDSVVEQKTILMFAALVGLFIVATQIVLGMFADFGRSPFAHSPRWLLTNAFFAGSTLLAVETARVVFLRTFAPKSLTLALLLTSAGLVAIPLAASQFTQTGIVAQAEFWGSVYIPLAATGLVAGFFVLYGGLRAGLLVSAPIVAFQYFSPILPVADWPMLALAGVGGPAVGLWVAEGLFAEAEEEEEERGFQLPSMAWTVTAVLALTIFWFSFGFFGYKPMFVPSTSMEPAISRGDAVLIGPIDPDSVEVGDVVLYSLGGATRVLHRVVDIRTGEDGQRVFVMKGDNNNAEDLAPIVDEQLLGGLAGSVPKIGWLPIKFQQTLADLK